MAELEQIILPQNDFRDRLDNNSKLLFSGIYGSGKTTFIKDFFDSNKNYDSIHLYPVNYSIAGNKDIFELIKYDILIELLGKLTIEEYDKIEIPYELTLWSYLTGLDDHNQKINFFASFLNFGGKLGKGFLKVYEQAKHLVEGYVQFHKNHQNNDFDEVKAYLNGKTIEKGHVYEEDFFTELIRLLLLKLSNKNKTTVLVVDDLDRLDPDHIFRILNIFSANFDFRGEKNDNKFGFDKIVLICDFPNLKSVFKHRHGKNADFEGYMDKFYSEIYWHNPSSFIKKIINDYLNSLAQDDDAEGIFSTRSRIGGQIQYVINQLLEHNTISFRELIKNSFFFSESTQAYHSNYKFRNSPSLLHFTFNALIVLRFFIEFFNNNSRLLEKIETAKVLEIHKGEDPYDGTAKDKISELVLFLNHANLSRKKVNDLKSGDDIVLNYKEYTLECSLIKRDYLIAVDNKRILRDGVELSSKQMSYFEVFEEAVKTYIDLISI